MNIIVQDIEKLKYNGRDYDLGFIKLVDILEKGLRDLAAIEAREQIANAYTVKLIEKQLPKRFLSKWLDLESKSETGSRRY